jgi:hypothetical protein
MSDELTLTLLAIAMVLSSTKIDMLARLIATICERVMGRQTNKQDQDKPGN